MCHVEYTRTAEKFFGELKGNNAKYIKKIMDKVDYCLGKHLFDYEKIHEILTYEKAHQIYGQL